MKCNNFRNTHLSHFLLLLLLLFFSFPSSLSRPPPPPPFTTTAAAAAPVECSSFSSSSIQSSHLLISLSHPTRIPAEKSSPSSSSSSSSSSSTSSTQSPHLPVPTTLSLSKATTNEESASSFATPLPISPLSVSKPTKVAKTAESSSTSSSNPPCTPTHLPTGPLISLSQSRREESVSSLSTSAPIRPPPLPIPPIPSAPQLSWQLGEMALFLHFGTNTFTDSEWGTGCTDPSVFNPGPTLNASQWVQIARFAGFSRVILTAKHHDGFCLWPSAYTNYSVAASPWRGGNGDVVADLAAAAREAGIGLGIYLSPWDRHEASYGKTLEYNEFYMGQMTELLTRYGEVKEVFLDGAKGEGEKDMDYYFESWFGLIHQLQQGATIFSDAGPDSRWVGDEAGVSGSTCWSIFNRSAVSIGGNIDNQYSRCGDPYGHDWVPPECDVSIRPGWFWHRSEKPKSAVTLLELYYTSVGRNCLLLLNVPPNSSGLISDDDIQVLRNFTELRHTIFSNNLAANADVTASSTRGINDPRFSPLNILEEGIFTYWAPEENQSIWSLYLDLGQTLSFNVLQIQEPIHMGQRVIEFHVDVLNEGEWKMITNGTTVGYKRLIRFSLLKSQQLRLVISNSRAEPLIAFLGIYLDQYSIIDDVSGTSQSNFNSSHIRMKWHDHSGNLSKATM